MGNATIFMLDSLFSKKRRRIISFEDSPLSVFARSLTIVVLAREIDVLTADAACSSTRLGDILEALEVAFHVAYARL